MSSTHPSSHTPGTGQDTSWSPAEKSIARKAFDLALQREFQGVITETKSKAAKIQNVSGVWDLERYLMKRRTEIDRQFDYRYSVLIQVFGQLLHQGKLNAEDLHGLSEDKLAAIRRFASFLGAPLGSSSGEPKNPESE